jgi:hypothetical protein
VQLAIVIEQPLCSGGLKEPLLCQLRYVDGKMSASHWQDHVSQYMNCSPIVLPRLCESQTHHEKLEVSSPPDSTSNGLNTPLLLKQLVERALLRRVDAAEQGRHKGLHRSPSFPTFLHALYRCLLSCHGPKATVRAEGRRAPIVSLADCEHEHAHYSSCTLLWGLTPLLRALYVSQHVPSVRLLRAPLGMVCRHTSTGLPRS